MPAINRTDILGNRLFSKISEFVLTVDMTCICEFATGVVMFAIAIMYLSIIVGLLASDSNSHDNVM